MLEGTLNSSHSSLPSWAGTPLAQVAQSPVQPGPERCRGWSSLRCESVRGDMEQRPVPSVRGDSGSWRSQRGWSRPEPHPHRPLCPARGRAQRDATVTRGAGPAPSAGRPSDWQARAERRSLIGGPGLRLGLKS